MRRHGDTTERILIVAPRLRIQVRTALALLVTSLAVACSDGSAPGPVPGTLRLHTSPVLTFDPAHASDVPSVAAVQKIYEAPLQFAYDDGPYRLIPGLAEAMPVFSEDNLVCTFAVRPDARFQDDPCFTNSNGRGRPVAGADVVYSLTRLADAKVVSPGFSFLRGRVAGLDAFHDAPVANSPRRVEGLTSEGRTVRITLVKPYPQLLWILAMSYACVIPHEAVEYYGNDFTRHPVGTGPYMLAGWIRNHSLDFAASPAWHGGAPGVNRIQQRMIADPTTRWMCFLRAALDICPDIPRDSWDAVMRPDGTLQPDLAARGITAASIPALTTAYIGLNMDDPVLGPNKALRRALNAMVDSAAWTGFYNSRIVPANGPIPPGIAGSRAATRKPSCDPETASRLLSEAGYTNGIDSRTGRRLQLQLELGRTDAETRESTELLVRFAERVGIVILPNYNTQSAFFRKLERRQAQMFRVGWVADYPDAENFLQLFYSPNASPGPNRANYHNPDFDRLYETVRTMPDSPQRTAIYEQMSAIVEEDCPWVFLHYPLDHVLQQPWVMDYRPHAFPYGMEKYYRIEVPRKPGERR